MSIHGFEILTNKNAKQLKLHNYRMHSGDWNQCNKLSPSEGEKKPQQQSKTASVTREYLIYRIFMWICFYLTD